MGGPQIREGLGFEPWTQRDRRQTLVKNYKTQTKQKNLKNKENSPKKRENISSDTLVSALSELQGLLSISPEKKKSKIGSKKPKKKKREKMVKKNQKKKKNLTSSGREPCVVLCGIIIKNKQTNCKLNKKMEKSLFKKHSGLFLDYCGRKPVKIAVS